jgi:hypothetical protein
MMQTTLPQFGARTAKGIRYVMTPLDDGTGKFRIRRPEKPNRTTVELYPWFRNFHAWKFWLWGQSGYVPCDLDGKVDEEILAVIKPGVDSVREKVLVSELTAADGRHPAIDHECIQCDYGARSQHSALQQGQCGNHTSFL